MKLSLSILSAAVLLFLGTVSAKDAEARMKRDPYGYAELGHDGIKRSFDFAGNVIDARALSPSDISSWISRRAPEEQSTLYARYANVDGRSVTNTTQIWHPSTEVVPRQRGVGSLEEAMERKRAAKRYLMQKRGVVSDLLQHHEDKKYCDKGTACEQSWECENADDDPDDNAACWCSAEKCTDE